MSLADFLNNSFGELKRTNPKEADRISSEFSGEPFGLYADTDAYRSSKTIYAEFDENDNLISDLNNI